MPLLAEMVRLITLLVVLSLTAAWSLTAKTTGECVRHTEAALSTRRSWLCKTAAPAAAATLLQPKLPSFAEDEEQEAYNNPNIPAGPEEKSGLVVLRVAEVAQFQEKILRAVLDGEIKDVIVTPQQLVFGTNILMRNSNVAGNMKLMIDNEIPRSKQREARIRAANSMNALQKISSDAAKIERAVKNSKHVMLFWESKLIHKLRGKTYIP